MYFGLWKTLGIKSKMTLVWRDHREYLKETLTRLKRFDQSTDVTLICADEEELKAHKIVLSASSQLFYSVLDNVPFNCVIHLPEVNYKDLSMILEYMYFGETSVNQIDLNSILSLAENLGIQSIVEKLQDKFNLEKGKESNYDEQNTRTDFVPLSYQPKELTFFRCIDCGETFDAKEDLNKHVKKHQKYDCEYCEEEFSDRSSLLDHIIAAHNTEEFDGQDTDPLVDHNTIKKRGRGRPPKSLVWKCDECDEVVTRNIDLVLHKSQTHGKENQEIANIKKILTEKQFPCPKCSIVCKSDARLQKHLWKHNKLSCKFCGSDYSSMQLLLRHTMRFHKEEISFNSNQLTELKMDSKDIKERKELQCPEPECGKIFSFKSAMKHHHESIHQGLKFPCNKCDYKSGNTSHLAEHIESIHLGVKYDCPVCGKRFTHKSHVRRHCKKEHASRMGGIVFSELSKIVA